MLSNYEYGKEFFEKGKLKKAEDYFLSVTESFNHIEDSFYYLGKLSFQNENIELAIDYFLKCLAINPYCKKAIIDCFKVVKLSSRYHLFLPIIKEFLNKYPKDEDINEIFFESQIFIKEIANPNFFECEKDRRHIPISYHKKQYEAQKVQIDLIDSILNTFNQKGYQYNKPHRNLILSGIPGSGIRLFINILNHLDNILCLDNFEFNIEQLPQIFCDIRNSLIKSPLNFLSQSSSNSNFSKSIDEDVVVGLQKNLGLLRLNKLKNDKNNELEMLLNYGYRIIAIIRDPVFTIAQWNSPEYNRFPEFLINDYNLSPCWHNINFASNNKFERQAQIWEFYAKLFLQLHNMLGNEKFWNIKIEMIQIYTYEQLIIDSKNTIKQICEFLSIPLPNSIEKFYSIDKLSYSLNPKHIKQIKEAVLRYCPTAKQLGYHSPGSENNLTKMNQKEVKSLGVIDYQEHL